MTIVETRPLYVTSTLDEGKRPDVADGQKAKIALPAEGADRLAAEVKSISPIPVSPGKFEINFELDAGRNPRLGRPRHELQDRRSRPTTRKTRSPCPRPPSTTTRMIANKKYVWLVNPDDEEAKPERRNVKLGKRSGDDVEIIKGLKEGDVVSLEDESKKSRRVSK